MTCWLQQKVIRTGTLEQQRVAREIVGEGLQNIDSRSKRIVVSSKLPSCKAVPKASAYRGGSKPRHSDQELKEMVGEHCVESCRWSGRVKAPMLTLKGSKSKVRRQLGAKLKIRKSQFNKRLKNARLGIATSKRRVDTCPSCSCWGRTMHKTIEHDIKDSVNLLVACQGNYFAKFIAEEVGDHADSAVWLVQLLKHIDTQMETCIDKECPCCMHGAAIKARYLEQYMSEVDSMTLHWALDKTLQKDLREALAHPKQNWLHMVYDFEDFYFVGGSP